MQLFLIPQWMKPHHKYVYVLTLKENQKKENCPSAQPLSLVLCPVTHMWCLMQVRYSGVDREIFIFVLTIYKIKNQGGRDPPLAAMESIYLRWNCPCNWGLHLFWTHLFCSSKSLVPWSATPFVSSVHLPKIHHRKDMRRNTSGALDSNDLYYLWCLRLLRNWEILLPQFHSVYEMQTYDTILGGLYIH